MSKINELEKLLPEARKLINGIDEKILDLLRQRMAAVEKVTLAKKKNGIDIFAPDRELELLERIEKLANKKDLDLIMVRDVFRSVIEGSKRAQRRALSDLMRIGFVKPRGSFCEQAAASQKVKEKTTAVVPFDHITAVFDALLKKKIELGVVPYQSSFEVGNEVSIDRLLRDDLQIVGEILIPVSVGIISTRPKILLNQIKKVYGSTWLFTRLKPLIQKVLPQAELIEVFGNEFYTTSVYNMDPTAVALGPVEFAKINELFVLKTFTHKQTQLSSRYVVISPLTVKNSGKSLTSFAVELPNKKGCLHQFTGILANAKINLLNINLIYLRRELCEHVFVVDVEGHMDEEPLKSALSKIKKMATGVKVFGSYQAHHNLKTPPSIISIEASGE